MSPPSAKSKKKNKGNQAAAPSSGKPPSDAYTGLLFAGFVAVATGCALLAVELATKYDWLAAK